MLKESDLLYESGAVYLQSFSLESLETLNGLLVHEDVSVPMTWLLDSSASLPSPSEIKKFAEFGTALGPDKNVLAEMDCGVEECNRPETAQCSDFDFNRTCTGRLKKDENGLALLSPLISLARDADLELHAYTFRNEELFMAIDFLADPLAEMEFFLNEANGITVDGFFTDCPETAAEYVRTSCSKENNEDNDKKSTRRWSVLITFVIVAVGVLIGATVVYIRHKKHKERIRFIELSSDTSPTRSRNYHPDTVTV